MFPLKSKREPGHGISMDIARKLAIGFDEDDTLWHCETHFAQAQAQFTALLEPYQHGHVPLNRLFENFFSTDGVAPVANAGADLWFSSVVKRGS